MDNELATNFANENLANLIFKKKLVPLLLDRHFALAASFQLYGYKAWKEFREASLEINFYNKRRDKKFPQQLRREQLDHKTFWSASFKALCLSTFDGNTFKEETFKEETFTEESFADCSLEEETFSDSNLEEETFSDSSLEEETFSESSFDKNSLKDSSFEDTNFEEETFKEETFLEENFEDSNFDKHSFYKNSLEENSFEQSSLTESSFEQNNLEESSLEPNRFEASSFPEDSFQDKSFTRRTSPTELPELECTALHTELPELERRALAKAAYSLELSPTTAQLDGKLSLFLGGSSSERSCCRGGVLRGSLPHTSLTLTRVSLGNCLGSSPASRAS